MQLELRRRSALVAGALALGGFLSPAPLLGAPKEPKRRPERLRLLVLGGTRYLGPAFVRAALARGHEVTLFNRGLTQPWLFPGLPKLVGNRFPDVGAGLSPLEAGNWDVAVDLCGQYPRIVDASTAFLRDRVEHYLMVSSISVYASYAEPNIDETAAVRPLTAPFVEQPDLIEGDWPTYGARKAAGEAIVAQRFPGRHTILRPCTICGSDNNDGTGAYWAERLFRDDRVLLPGDGTDPVQLVDVRDVADFAILACENRATGIFNVVGPARPITARDYIDACARVVGSGGSITWKGDFPREMHGVPIIPPGELVPGFARIRNARAVSAGLTFRDIKDTILTNWVDHRARRGGAYDFSANGIGLAPAREAALFASSPRR